MPSDNDSLRFDVAISGASFAGLALACALSRALGPEVRIAVIDRAPLEPAAVPDDGRALAVSGASRSMLETIGLWRSIADEAQAIARIEITDSSLDAGVRPVLLAFDNTTDGGDPASYIVPNPALQTALRKAVEASACVTVIAPAEAAAFEAGDAQATVGLADGRKLAAALVVAAEGRRSRLREAAGIKVIGWAHPQTGIVTTVRHALPHKGVAVQHFLPAGPFAILPLKGNRSCITWTEDAREAERILALDDGSFLAEVEKRFGGKLGEITLDGPRRSWPLEMHLARRYVGKRFALIGDAAHGVHPLAGQGLNLAFRDVAALSESIADAMRLGFDAGDAQALTRYERWRRFDSTVSALTFDGLNRLFANDLTLLRAGREMGLGLVDRMPLLKRFFVGEAAGITGELPRLLRGEAI